MVKEETCFATWDCDGTGGYDCELPAGHDGPHRIVIEWDEEPRPPVTAPISEGWKLFLTSRYGVTK